jgi:ApaG protein
MARYHMSCTVVPQYLAEQSNPAEGVFAFAYAVTIRNAGEVPAQVVSRHWFITDSAGKVDEVKGLGVVGHQPLLKPGEAFEYTSWTRLATATGAMRGSYFCVAEDGERFEAQIPEFALVAELHSGHTLH